MLFERKKYNNKSAHNLASSTKTTKMLASTTTTRASKMIVAIAEAAGLRRSLSRSEAEVEELKVQLGDVEEELQSALFAMRDLKIDLESRRKKR